MYTRELFRKSGLRFRLQRKRVGLARLSWCLNVPPFSWPTYPWRIEVCSRTRFVIVSFWNVCCNWKSRELWSAINDRVFVSKKPFVEWNASATVYGNDVTSEVEFADGPSDLKTNEPTFVMKRRADDPNVANDEPFAYVNEVKIRENRRFTITEPSLCFSRTLPYENVMQKLGYHRCRAGCGCQKLGSKILSVHDNAHTVNGTRNVLNTFKKGGFSSATVQSRPRTKRLSLVWKTWTAG